MSENQQTGNPPSEWDISGAGDLTIQGFATDISVNKGETVHFKIDTDASQYHIDIYRLGYYQGNGARMVGTGVVTATLPQTQPPCDYDSSTGLTDCGNWQESAHWAVPTNAVSGIYIAKLTRDDTSGASHILFIVRDDSSLSDLLFQTSDTTSQAYNSYGGNSLYGGSTSYPSGRAAKVSYNRPFVTRGGPPEDWIFNAEYPMVRWLEANGYDVTYTTGVDSDRRGELILNHQVFLSVGHDEYWSAAQRASVQAARDAGVHLAFFSGNEIYWKIRWESSLQSGDSHRTLVCYKEGTLGENQCGTKCDPLTNVWTGLWRDGCSFSPPADGCAPENALSGQISWQGSTGTIEVPDTYKNLRFWRNTAVASLGVGQAATLAANTLGYEWDWQQYEAYYPPRRILLSTTVLDGKVHHLSLYRHTSGALVFGAGTVQWSWGLDGNHDRGGSTPDVTMQQATVNLLADMGAQPGSLQSNLVSASASSDVDAPVSVINSPINNASLPAELPVTISGTASDVGGGVVAGIEVSVDGGATWSAATGTTNWTYAWTPSTQGTVTIKSRAFDDTGNLEIPGVGEAPSNVVTVTVTEPPPPNCPCTIFQPTDTPQSANLNDGQPLELGVKFRASVDGYITGIRFYKGNLNTGTHTGHLWSNSGTMLAEATFTGETASGWQEVSFSSPVAITAGTTYIASYHSSSGYYADTNPYFTQAVVNYPLRALANGEDGPNGVYVYSATSAFPTDNYQTSNYWVDPVFNTTAGPDETPPTVTTVAPTNGAAAVSVNTNATAAFSEAIDPLTVNSSTFELRDPSNTLISATVTYHSSTHTATLTPSTPLAYSTTYTGTLKGGATDPRIKDPAGNALAADYVWSFTTASPPPPPPTEGPGGPILIIASAANPFGRYYAEILRAEGLNEFTVTDITLVTAATLTNYDVVILGELPLNAAQVTMFDDWVNDGGNLIAMRPDKQLAGLLGLTDASGTLSNAYLRIYGSGAGAGIVTNSIQFHGVADRYTLNGATALAALYSSATNDTGQPAVTVRSVGSNGGHAAAFAFDLARSVVYTRQGNPAWAGQKRDGQIPPTRSDDMYWGNAAFDPQTDWIDLTKVAIPQADEQQRLFANMILQISLSRKPLPRFWYFPRGFKAVVIMTGDQHGCCGATRSRFERYVAQSPTNCSVADWDCVRASSYIYASSDMSDSEAKSWTDQGFELGVHVNTGCADWTASSLDSFYTTQLAAFTALYPSIPDQVSHRTHCVAWSDWASQPNVELAHGIRLDVNYYYWPPGWVQDRPGFFTGSGMPMRFAELDGTIIDVYQAASQMTDESGQSYPFTINTLLDRAVGPEGYYGVFTANHHTDNAAPYGPSEDTVASAQARGVPVVSGRQMLEWLDGRNNSSFGSISWSGDVLGFTVVAAPGSRNMQGMVPTSSTAGALSAITRNGNPLAYSTQTIKGIEYAFFSASNGNYEVSYAPDTTPPVISAVTATPGLGGTATITWTTDEPANSRVGYGTSSSSLTLVATDGALVTSHGLVLTGLAPSTTYYYRVTSADASNNSATSPASPAPPASFLTPSASFIDTATADFGAGTPGGCTIVSQLGDGEVILTPALNEDFSGTSLSNNWTTVIWNAGGSATVGSGLLAVNGAAAATTANFGPASAIEFVATFQAGPYQNVGFASNSAFDAPWLTFGTSGAGNGVYARASNGADILISAGLLGSPHRYRIVWNTSSFDFYVDGAPAATINLTVGVNMVAAVSDYPVDAASLQVDWLRVTPYATPCTFDSRVFDAGTNVFWGTLAWTAETPTGTTLNLSYRIGDTPTPDGSWTAFAPVSVSGGALAGSSRYIQYEAQLATSDTSQTPVLEDVTISYSLSSNAVPPVISEVTATAGPSDTATITWTTDEPANSRVDYGTSSNSLTLVASDGSLVTSHSVVLTGLAPATTYYFRVTSADAETNSTTSPASPAPPASFATADTMPPVISALTATAGVGGTATITWTTDEPANSRVDYGTSSNSLTLVVTNGALVTSHGLVLTGLAPSTTYFYRATSADAANNSATSPASPAPPASFLTPSAILVDTTVADFGAGTTGANTYVAQTADGEVILSPTVGAEFYGSLLPADWFGSPWVGGGSVTVSGGNLVADDALAGTTNFFGPGYSLEFVATFNAANQHVGFGFDFNIGSWAIFSVRNDDPTQLRARTSPGTETVLGSSWLNSPHLYRIDWTATNVVFSVDGTNVATHATAITGNMRPLVSDANGVGVGGVVVDWMRMSPYTASGTFVSRVFDGGAAANWGALSWTSETPTGTTVALSYRIGNTPTPDGSWTAFTLVSTSGGALAGNSRYIQYTAELTTSDPTQTPVLEDVTISYDLNSDTTPPTITSRSPAPGATDVATNTSVGVSFSEPMDAATITTTSFRLRRVGDSVDVAATVTNSGATATLTPNSPLSPGQSYQVTVAATVADVSGNLLGSADVWTFWTAPVTASQTDTTVADFSAGSTGDCSAVTSQIGDGEVILAPTLNEDFSGTTLPASWSSSPWAGGGSVTVAGGTMTVDGALAQTTAAYGSGRSLEFVATFGAVTFQHVGFASDSSFSSYAIFSTFNTTSSLYARTSNGANTLISGSWLGSPHRYRIDWTASSIVFSIDGVQVASHAVAIGASMRPVVSDFAVGGAIVTVDWMRMTPYATPCTFSSRIIDAGQAVTWYTLAWTADTPAATTVAMSYRIGNTPTPDGTWTAFSPVSTSGGTLTGSSRYIQYAAELATSDTTQTPVLKDVTVTYILCAPPLITDHPSSVTNCAGDSATFTVTATGDGLTYQWREDGVNIDSATSNSYTIASTATGDAGSYDVVVSGACGSPTTSNPATLTVNTAPTIVCPADMAVPAAHGQCTSNVAFAVTAGGSPAPSVECKIGSTVITSPHAFPVGTNTVDCTAQNSCGTAACSFKVMVADTQPPAITCPADLSLGTDAGLCTASNVTFAATANDNCPGVSYVCVPASGSTFAQGTNSVTCTATDGSGNTNSCSFTVTVNDIEPPVIGACPASFTVTDNDNSGDEVVTFATPSASDNCPGATVSCAPTNGSLLAVGAHTITCTATDGSGNTNSCSFTVAVCSGSQPTVYVDDGYTGKPIGTAVNFPDNGGAGPHIVGCDAFASITGGVAAVANNGTVNVAAGTYVENISIAKSLHLLGAGSGTVIYPAVSDVGASPDAGPSFRGSQVIVVTANNVEIAYLTVDGDNPNLTSGVVRGGADIDARNGIIEGDPGPYSGLEVHDCTVQNIYLRGIYPRQPSATSAFNIYSNLVQNVQGGPSSIAIFNFGGGGVMASNTVADASDAISANWSTGTIFLDNTVTTSGSGVHTDNNGGLGGVADLLKGNTVLNCTNNGYGVWVFAPYRNVVVEGNLVSNVTVGLAAAGQQAAVTVLFTNNTVIGNVDPNGAGVYVTTSLFGFGSDDVAADFGGNSISNCAFGFFLESETGYALQVSAFDNSIAGNTLAVQTNALGGSFSIDASGNWWDTAVPAGVAALIDGPVDYTPWLDVGTDTSLAMGFQGDFSYLHVSAASPQTGSTGRIQEGVNLVSGSTVHVVAGIYDENVVATVSNLTLFGDGQGLTIVRPAVSSPTCVGGSLCPGHSTIILVQADDVTIHDMTLDGDNPSLTSGVVRVGADLDARNGIITDHTLGTWNGLEVHDVTVTNIYLRAIYASSGGTFNFFSNTVSNVRGEGASVAVFNFGGSGVFAFNNVSDANDAISANHSSGTQFLTNTVSNCDSGLHTDNAGDGGGSADLLAGNVVTNGSGGFSFGVWVFVPYLAPTLQGNEVSGCFVGMAAFGQGAAVTSLFISNVVDGLNAVGTYGAAVSTSIAPFGSTDVNATFIGNQLVGTDTGLDIENEPGFNASTTAKSNMIGQGDVGVLAAGSLTKVLLQGNDLTANSSDGIKVFDGATVDAGDCSGSNVTGLGTGSGANGSSNGGNTLSGYGFDNLAPWAIENLNSNAQPNVLAQLNSYGAGSGDDIGKAIYDSSDNGSLSTVIYSQSGGVVVSCPPATNVQCVADVPSGATSLAQFVAQGGLASCSPATVSFSDGPLTPGPSEGTITRTYTVSDACGQTNTCLQTITVDDTIAPVITACATNQTLFADGSCQATLPDLTGEVVASDNCGGTPTVTQSPVPSTLLGLGTNAVILTADDGRGNSSSCTTTVTVVDTTVPTLSCPANITSNTAPGLCTAVVDFITPTGSDNCTNVTVVCAPPSGSTFSKGTNTVVCTATDGSGNSNTCSFTVTVYDSEPPVIGACPSNMAVTDTDNSGDETATFSTPTATDNCTNVTVACVPASGSTFLVGTTTVTCTATDDSGNTNSCEFTVAVCTATQLVVYVDDNYTNYTSGSAVNFPDNGAAGPHIVGCDAFASITGGVARVADSGTVNVAAGLYVLNSNVTLNKSISIIGPNAGISPRNGGGGRVAEAVINGGAPGAFTGSSGYTFNLASGITSLTVSGLKFTKFDGNMFASSLVPVTNVSLHQNLFDNNNGGLFYKFDTSVATEFDVADNRIANQAMTGANTALLFLGNVGNSHFDSNEVASVTSRELLNIYAALTNTTISANTLTNTAGLASLFADQSGVAINNNSLTNITIAGGATIYVGSNNGHNISNLEVKSNTVLTVNGASGIIVACDTATSASITDVAIENNTINRSLYGISLDTIQNGTGTISNVSIKRNTLIDNTFSPILAYSRRNNVSGTNIVRNLTIENNTISVNAALYGASFYLIDFRSVSGTNSFKENTFSMSGVLPGGTDALRAIGIRGNRTGMFNINDNSFNGGGVAHNNAPTVPVSGIVLLSKDATDGNIPASAVINATENSITGFEYGVLVRDGVGLTYGGLVAGVDANINSNSIAGNSALAIRSGAGELIDASANWWGTNTLAGVTALLTTNVDYTPWLDVGTDTSGSIGFQGDYATLIVTATSPQSGATGRIQEGIDLAGTTVKILGGSYTENVDATLKAITLSPGASPAQVTINGDFTLDGDDTLAMELNGNTPGTDYDQFIVNGMVTLGSATLSATAGFSYADCVSLTLIDNDSTDPVSGTFNGLSNGVVVNISGQDFKIFYDKGTGNDVVLVKDTTPPSITCPTNLTVSCASQVPAPDTNSVSTADACGSVTVSFEGDVISGQTCSNRYTITRTYKATDENSNTNSCQQTITVDDETPPSFTFCPTNVVLACGASTDPSNTGSATATDNCGDAPSITHVDSPTAPNCTGQAGINRLWIATDACGNSATCTVQSITFVDTTPPVFTFCPTNVVLACGNSTNPTNTGSASATDNCGGTPSITHVDTPTAPNCTGQAGISRLWIATDACGNSATCAVQNISFTDTTPPVAVCSNITVHLNAGGFVIITAEQVDGGSYDNCGNPVTLQVNPTIFGCGNVGPNPVTLKVTDTCGNSNSCVATVTVLDVTPPALTCPADVTTNANPGQCFATGVVLGNATATDNCGAFVTTNAPTFLVGTNFVVWSAVDGSGNISTCTQKVVVVDNQTPLIACSDVTVTIPDTMTCACDPALDSPVVSDNCDVGSVVNDAPSCFDVGTSFVVWTATDIHGNSASCTQQVFVVQVAVDESTFNIVAIDAFDEDITLTWQTFGNSTNVIQLATPIIEGNYTNSFVDLDTVIVPGSGVVITNWVDYGGATNDPARYYRLRFEPGPPCPQ